MVFSDFRNTIGSWMVPSFDLCPFDKSSMYSQVRMVRWYNHTDKGKLKYWEKNMSQFTLSATDLK
jgi:hypothetical protein